MISSAPLVSVIVCCFNSESRIRLLTEGLGRLERPEGGMELLLVDNASRDGTRAGLESIAQAFHGEAQVIEETRPGLMYARCAAVSRSRGAWVIFFDDDNEPNPDYVRECLRLAGAYPRAVIATGNSVLPEHLRKPAGAEVISRALALREDRGEFGFQMDRIHYPHAPFGAGMCTRGDLIRSACQSWLEGSQKVVGRQGASLSSSEDVWLAHFLTRDGGEVVFSDRLVLKHHLRPDRLEAEYLCRLAYAIGRGYWDLVESIRELRPGLEGLPRSVGSLLNQELLKGFIKALKLIVNPSYDSLGAMAFSVGVIAGCYFRKLNSEPQGSSGK